MHGLWPIRVLKWWYTHKQGAPYSQLFFHSLRSKSKRIYGSYSLHIRMFRYIHKHHLFASFVFIFASKYSHRFAYKYSIWCKKHVAVYICFRANIRWRFSHTGENLLKNIRLAANIRKTLSEFYIQANIHLQIFAYQQIFATYCLKLFRKAFHKS